MPNNNFTTIVANAEDEIKVRMECLRLALGRGSSHAAVISPLETPQAVVARAQSYFDFVANRILEVEDRLPRNDIDIGGVEQRGQRGQRGSA